MIAKEKIIELKDVAVYYKQKTSFFKSKKYWALSGLCFDVYKGETLAILGRNGAGKSTLLRLLAGIIKPDSGSIIHHTKSVSLMALAAGFDTNLSGRENSLISGMLLGYSKKNTIRLIDKIKQFSELQDFFEHPVKTYSSGMKARLAFSIAMYLSPDVLLIDEVLGVGDVSFKDKAERVLEDKINSDMTVIIVSHSEKQVNNLAERVVWIDGGVVRKTGKPSEIFSEYNINSNFSTYGLKVVDYKFKEDYFFQISIESYKNGRVEFECVAINLENRKIDSLIFFETLNDDVNFFELDSPTATPKYKKMYPDLDFSDYSRFNGGVMNVSSAYSIYAICDGIKEEVLSFSIEKV
ncbi:ABC transporter ATP-binding protein [Marinomonas pollencensis]|uniref:ABC-type polysaccharide/polyol phosphate transport system ATPase subunit n=1 Tax=Marinomonas pollencensis TaxID=491954 RepID=A0A3E0D9X6_9GAMM|nr:ABC transporter ATP-binding protein [Marinomonas pollencensis]REG78348.1 ABC-type polysaccharide/polyol phosphate transport system ATPase subunit [Marinomonas pollencensis]